MLLEKVKKEGIVMIDGEFYRLVGDYSEVQTKYDYEFQHVENDKDTFMLSTYDLITKLRNSWKIVET